MRRIYIMDLLFGRARIIPDYLMLTGACCGLRLLGVTEILFTVTNLGSRHGSDFSEIHSGVDGNKRLAANYLEVDTTAW